MCGERETIRMDQMGSKKKVKAEGVEGRERRRRGTGPERGKGRIARVGKTSWKGRVEQGE
jgi:hypothetical protein